VVSESPEHYLNECDPALVTSAICEVVHSARTGAPLGAPAAASEGD
jgi:hypothetical protein